MAVQLTVGGLPPVMPQPGAPVVSSPYQTSTQDWQQRYQTPGWSPGAVGVGGGVSDPQLPGYQGTTPQVSVPSPQIGPNMGTDWTGMIGGSWEVAQAEAFMAEQMARARDSFTGDLRSAFINLGYTGDQSQLGNLSQYLDQSTIQNAISNKYSLYQQIADSAAKSNATNDAQLAARGILQSGQTAKSASDVAKVSEQSRYDALRNFLTSGSTGLTHLGDMEAQLAQGVANARFAAAQRLAAMYPYGTGGGGGGSQIPVQEPVQTWYNGMPYQGGWIVSAGNASQDNPSGDPYYVAPSSGTGGDLSWLSGLGG
jgi:hypothetical protein